MIEIAHSGRIASKSAEARARISAGQERQRSIRKNWQPSTLPAWLNRESYRQIIWPKLAKITVPNLAEAMQVSESYATKVRKGRAPPNALVKNGRTRQGIRLKLKSCPCLSVCVLPLCDFVVTCVTAR